MTKAWQPLDAEHVARLSGQLGVYELADASGNTVRIGFAGGRSAFGLRSELERQLAAHPEGFRFRVEVNMQYTTQYGDTFGVTAEAQNGYTTGQYSSVSVSPTGIVQANYTNGQSVALGQVAVANFANQLGLQQVDNTNWVQTFTSGPAVYGQAEGAGFGTIDPGSRAANRAWPG